MRRRFRTTLFGGTLCWFLLGALPSFAQTISTGDGLSLSLGADGRVTSVVVDGSELLSSPAAAISVRDLSAAGSVFTPSLLYNGGFETDDGQGGAAGWSVYLEQNAQVRIVTDKSVEGARSLFIETDPGNNANGTAVYLSGPIAVTSGTRYRFSAQVVARDGYLTLNRTAPGWQRDIYDNPLSASGLYVAWFETANGSGDPSEVTLLAPMHTNARVWKRITGEAVAPSGALSARVLVGAKLLDSRGEDDAIWIDDVSMVESAEAEVPVTGTVAQVGGELAFSGSAGGTGLDVEATYRALADRIEVTGRVIDTTPSDRALQLSIRFPLDLDGYRWWDDIRESRAVGVDASYSNWVSADVGGFLPQSLYPLAALDDGTRAIAVAIPLDSPRVVLLGYGGGRLEARFHLGISPAAVRLGSGATFGLYLYRSDAQWGFRAALRKFQTFHPEWFSTSRPVYDFAGFAQGRFLVEGGCLPECEATCQECCAGAYLAACYDDESVATAQYTAPEGPTRVGDAGMPPPSYDEALARLGDPPPSEEERYAALAASMVFDGNGDYFMKQMVNPNWAPNDWVANWVLNMDPEITGGYAEWNRTARVDLAFTATQAIGAQLDGIELDNFMSAPAVDLDLVRFPLADHPLTYDPNTYRPGIHTMSSTFEYLAWLRNHVDTTYGNYAGFSANIWGVGTLDFLAPFLDFLPNETSGEGSSNWKPAWLDYRRTIAYHKPVAAAFQRSAVTAETASQFGNQAMFYGMPVSRGNNAASWESGAEEILAEVEGVVSRFWQLGWEPVTYATTDDPDVWVERFGAGLASAEDTVYFTMHRWDGLPAAYVLSIDTAALGLSDPPVVVVKDGRSGETLTYAAGAGTLTVAGSLDAGTTDLVRLMSPGCEPAGLASASLVSKPSASDDRLRLKGSFAPPGSPPDFTGSEVTFRVADRDGEIYLARVPAGGFAVSSSGRTFTFKDRTGGIANGLTMARFSRKRDGSYKWRAKARNVDLSGADRDYVDVMIHVGAACWADMRNCATKASGKKLVCRP